jgi:hypothetical protein
LRHSGRFHGVSWDTQKIRRIREFGWFLQHEADMIDAARQKSAERARREADLRKRPARARRCPICGREVTAPPIEDTGVSQCEVCGGFFFARGESGQLRLESRRHRPVFGREPPGPREH